MNQSAVKAAPHYIFGAFKSRAKNYSSFDNRTRQNVCLLATISHFTLKCGSTCFAATATILNQFNSICSSFGVKEISRSTLFTIQKRLSNLNYIIVESEYDNAKGKHNRKIALNMETIEYSFTDVFNLAVSRATAFLNRILDSNRIKKEVTEKGSNNNNLGNNGKTQNWTRITNTISKDIIKNKKDRTKTPNGAFYTSRFKRDADQAYQLEQSARNGSISAGGAKKLISLHTKHNVFLKPSFLKFLQYRIFNFVVKPQKPASEFKSTNTSKHTPISKKRPAQPVEAQETPRPNHMNNETLSKGNEIRDRIRAKIKAAITKA